MGYSTSVNIKAVLESVNTPTADAQVARFFNNGGKIVLINESATAM